MYFLHESDLTQDTMCASGKTGKTAHPYTQV